MTLGVIGGLGPIATAYFMELVIKMTDAERDQEHIEMIVYNFPKIPDRTAYILGQSRENPVDSMIAIGKKLEAQGADYIAIPCVTAHYFHKELSESIRIPILHAIRETGEEILKKKVGTVGLMATDGTVQSGIFQKQLEEMGLKVLAPESEYQRLVMDIIYKNVKAGNPPDIDKFNRVSRHLRERGAKILILGCTELSLIMRDFSIGKGYVDVMEVLAQRAVLLCRGKLKEKYRKLIDL